MSNHQSSAVFFVPPTMDSSSSSSWELPRATPLPLSATTTEADPATTGRSKQAVSGANPVLRAQSVLADVAVHPGQFLSAALVEREKMRDMLITSIRRFSVETVDAYRVTPETAEAAVALIKALRGSMPLPKIAPDGEGGLMAVWEGEHPAVALTVDNWKVHMVTGAATAQAMYFNDLPFDGIRLPRELLEFVPKL